MNDLSKRILQNIDMITDLDRSLLARECETAMHDVIENANDNIHDMLTSDVRMCDISNIKTYTENSVKHKDEINDLLESMVMLGGESEKSVVYFSKEIDRVKHRHDYTVDLIETKCKCTYV